MPDASEDFWTADGPERDRWGRPILVCRDGERRPHTRASSLSDYLADYSFLWKWKMRYLARSLGQNPDLAALAGAECYTTGFDKGEEKENRASGRRLDEIIERALDRGGISEKADYGTVVHALTEPGNDGAAFWGNVDTDVESYHAKNKELGAVTLATEVFTANDELLVAGTFDNLKYIPGYGICITDKKTSASVHGEDFRIQLSTYANADVYDWETNERQTLEEFVATLGWDPVLLNRKDGFIFWIKNGKTQVVRLDLEAGYEAAHHAVWVRDNHRKGKHVWEVEDEIRAAKAAGEAKLIELIGQAPSVDVLNTLWDTMDVRASWTPAATDAARKRRREIEEAA